MTKTRAKTATAIVPIPTSVDPIAKESSHQAPTAQDESQPRRGRGRPKKATAVESGPSEAPEPMEAVTRKRARNDASIDEKENEPAKKRTKEAGHDENSPPSPQTKGKRGRRATTVAPRDQLPDRPGRNVHPVPKAATRRTSEEVKAAQEARAREIERQIQELETAKRLLAQANVAEDVGIGFINSNYPTRLSAALRKRGHVEDHGMDGEHFDFQEADEMSVSSDGEEPEDVAPKKRGRPAKGSLRKEIRDMEGKVQEEDGGRERKKTKLTNVNFPPLACEPKAYQNAGLRKGFKSKNQETFDPLSNGGLDDEDALSTRPDFSQARSSRQAVVHRGSDTTSLTRDHTRKNELVKVEVEASGGEVRRPKARSKRVKAGQAKGQQPPVAVSNSTEPPSTDFTKDRRFAKIFLPTLNHALYISREPFKHFTLESAEFLAAVQEAFNLAFSNVSRTLTSADEVTKQAYQRIKTRKSKLAAEVLNVVKKFFEQPEFAGKPEATRKYVTWALAPGGPAYYAKPIPKQDDPTAKGRKDKDQGDKPKPSGFLETQFIAPIAKHYLSYASNSLLDPPIGRKNPPKGLYALIMTAVERAFFAHIKGTYADPKQFNNDNCWKPLVDFLANLDKVKEEQWASILQFDGADIDDEPESKEVLQADQSMISAFRAGIYLCSSPVKA